MFATWQNGDLFCGGGIEPTSSIAQQGLNLRRKPRDELLPPTRPTRIPAQRGGDPLQRPAVGVAQLMDDPALLQRRKPARLAVELRHQGERLGAVGAIDDRDRDPLQPRTSRRLYPLEPVHDEHPLSFLLAPLACDRHPHHLNGSHRVDAAQANRAGERARALGVAKPEPFQVPVQLADLDRQSARSRHPDWKKSHGSGHVLHPLAFISRAIGQTGTGSTCQ